jgi:hypothetical protein
MKSTGRRFQELVRRNQASTERHINSAARTLRVRQIG